MNFKELILDSLALPTNAIAYNFSQALAAFCPDKAIIEGNEGNFQLEAYAQVDLCTIELQEYIHNQIFTSWDGLENRIRQNAENVWYKVTWQGKNISVFLMTWTEGWCKSQHYWVVAENKAVAEVFFRSVCEWNAEIREEVLVFEEGDWAKNPELFQAIQSATFDNLILQGTLKQDIQQDLETFFASRDAYNNYGVPWKRGILFIGSPGNGKTHTVKALINKTQQPCLYVKSLKAQYSTDSDNIRKVFHQARQSAPCILVLEDIDSLLTDENRSFFLNELDGFAANLGIVTVATTNHPEKLDSAIIERPSRFDRKYHFDLPDTLERQAYLTLWNSQLQPEMQLDDATINQVVESTAGFSFAYLKELLLSSMMRWMGTRKAGEMPQIISAQITSLSTQMQSKTSAQA